MEMVLIKKKLIIYKNKKDRKQKWNLEL